MSQLSAGICLRLHNADTTDDDLFNAGHTVQFLSIKQVTPAASGNNAALDRYRIIISDGEHFLQAMLATQLNTLVQDNSIGKNTVAIIDKLTCNFVQNKRLIIILALRVVSTNEEKIGSPSAIAAPPADQPAISTGTKAGPSTSAAAVPVQQQPPKAPPARQQPPAQRGARPGSIYPIEGLSPYQNNWTIKARVTQKSDIKTWSNQRGEGKLFNVTLMDESGEIRATGFNQVVDELYDKLEEGKVYFLSKARVNLAKKKFSNLANDYELSLEKNTEIEECHETTNVPMVKYNFVQLSGLESLAKDAVCDVIGVVKDRGDLSTITSKTTNKSIPKRELTLVDKSEYSVRLTLWGKQAEEYNAEDNVVIAFKGVRVGDFGGRSLSMYSSSTMTINPDIEETFALRGWFDAVGVDQSFQSHTNSFGGGAGSSGIFDRKDLRNLNEVKMSGVGTTDKGPENFSTRATIMHIKSDNLSYPACPTQGCNKKVTDMGNGWRCEKCDRSFEKPEHRYIISMAVADWSGQAWLQGFNDAGVIVFGHTADELNDIKERDEAKFNLIVHKANSKTFNFACRAKQDTYNEQTRVRYGISRIMPLDYRQEGGFLRDLLRTPWAR